jgi:hypothetical protein
MQQLASLYPALEWYKSFSALPLKTTVCEFCIYFESSQNELVYVTHKMIIIQFIFYLQGLQLKFCGHFSSLPTCYMLADFTLLAFVSLQYLVNHIYEYYEVSIRQFSQSESSLGFSFTFGTNVFWNRSNLCNGNAINLYLGDTGSNLGPESSFPD